MFQRWMKVVGFFCLLLGTASLGLSQDKKATDKKAEEKSAHVAHLRLSGSLDETPVAADPLFGTSAENFRSKIDRILKAKNDSSVQALLIHVDGVHVGWAKVEELRAAIAEFRKTGKKAYAYLESGDAHDYLIGSECDAICVPAPGWLMLVGVQAEVTFYQKLLEKLGIKADFLQMGVYKFAAEPFTRSTMSPEAKAQLKLVLDSFFEQCLVGGISRSRTRAGKKNLTPQRLMKMIDEGPFTARKALDLGLVDHVAYAEDFENIIKSELGVDKLKVTRNYGQDKSQDIDLSNPFNILKLFAPTKTGLTGRKDRIAVIYAVGPITTGKGGHSLFGGNVVGSTSMIEAIRQAEKDPKVRAIVLRVDSPGGSALASDLIWNELKKCKKPVIASMSDVAASGGYYISMAAKKIYAQPGTLTGSIGVVGGKIALQGLYDKIGITTETIQRGQNAGIFSSTFTFSKSQRKAMETLMEEVYDQFLTKAVEGRVQAGKKFTKKELRENFAEGRIWTGKQALEHGLIDALGSLDDAVAEAKVMGGLSRDTEVDFLVLPKPKSFLDTLLEKGIDSQVSLLSAEDLARFFRHPELARHLGMVDTMLQLRSEPVWLMVPHALQIR